jgi:hypothetical protein
MVGFEDYDMMVGEFCCSSWRNLKDEEKQLVHF